VCSVFFDLTTIFLLVLGYLSLWHRILSIVHVSFGPLRFIICVSFCLHVLQAATKTLARQLVRLRQQITNLQGSRAQMRGIATHTQVASPPPPPKSLCVCGYFCFFFFFICALCSSNIFSHLQAMHAQSSVAVGMKGATKAMTAMTKVRW
jgi:hypothetical protein